LHFAHLMSRKCNDPEFFASVFKSTLFTGVLRITNKIGMMICAGFL
jgi:hypothetical protein